jgi:hypothetical protein
VFGDRGENGFIRLPVVGRRHHRHAKGRLIDLVDARAACARHHDDGESHNGIVQCEVSCV